MFILPDSTTDGLAEAQLRNLLEPLSKSPRSRGSPSAASTRRPGWPTSPPDEKWDAENMVFAGSVLRPLAISRRRCKIPARFAAQLCAQYPGKRHSVRRRERDQSIPARFCRSLDNHNGTPGHRTRSSMRRAGPWHSELCSLRGGAQRAVLPRARDQCGGRAVAWAEENSRDAIFTALRNRETYATSGTVPSCASLAVSTFPRTCASAATSRSAGTRTASRWVGVSEEAAMGSRRALPSRSKMSVGRVTPASPATRPDRQRLGGPKRPARHAKRCMTLRDITTALDDLLNMRDEGQCIPALHRVDGSGLRCRRTRILLRPGSRDPSCRWTQSTVMSGRRLQQSMGTCRAEDPKFNGRDCNSNDECSGGVCTLPDSYEEVEYRQCCGNVVPMTVQQRAWTSPIWYAPLRQCGARRAAECCGAGCAARSCTSWSLARCSSP